MLSDFESKCSESKPEYGKALLHLIIGRRSRTLSSVEGGGATTLGSTTLLLLQLLQSACLRNLGVSDDQPLTPLSFILLRLRCSVTECFDLIPLALLKGFVSLLVLLPLGVDEGPSFIFRTKLFLLVLIVLLIPFPSPHSSRRNFPAQISRRLASESTDQPKS